MSRDGVERIVVCVCLRRLPRIDDGLKIRQGARRRVGRVDISGGSRDDL